MKPVKKLCLFGVVMLLSSLTNAQVDTLGTSDDKKYQDSIEYLKPEMVDPNLDMIVAPSTFVVSEAFNGYISYENSTAIIMTQINNANYLKIAEGMDDTFYKANNLNFISKEKFTSNNGVKGVMFKLWFELKGDKYIRYMVYSGDLSKTLWLNITYPQMLEELIEMELLESIKTINLNL
jgi:hypothetical protein